MKSIAIKTMSAAAGALMAAGPVAAQDDRIARGEAVVRTLNGGQAQPTLEGLRRDFP
jgi:4-carboxymuconolactone decarboxylase